GRKAEVYGEPPAVPESALGTYEEAAAAGITVIETPGHSPHHICFAVGDDLFLGEAAGTFSTLGLGPDTPDYYLRPATPPRFDLEVAQGSLRRLLALDPLPGALRFAHHGSFSGDGSALLQAAHDQFALWVDVCRDVAMGNGGVPADAGAPQHASLLDAITAELNRRDPLYAHGAALPADIREREADFTRQSLRGMLGYLRA
ncbi:hypothetical protein COW53_09015, partial [bacterium CG17_big_fil_post_rev_8_21_14_2_50_64_8]